MGFTRCCGSRSWGYVQINTCPLARSLPETECCPYPPGAEEGNSGRYSRVWRSLILSLVHGSWFMVHDFFQAPIFRYSSFVFLGFRIAGGHGIWYLSYGLTGNKNTLLAAGACCTGRGFTCVVRKLSPKHSVLPVPGHFIVGESIH